MINPEALLKVRAIPVEDGLTVGEVEGTGAAPRKGNTVIPPLKRSNGHKPAAELDTLSPAAEAQQREYKALVLAPNWPSDRTGTFRPAKDYPLPTSSLWMMQSPRGDAVGVILVDADFEAAGELTEFVRGEVKLSGARKWRRLRAEGWKIITPVDIFPPVVAPEARTQTASFIKRAAGGEDETDLASVSPAELADDFELREYDAENQKMAASEERPEKMSPWISVILGIVFLGQLLLAPTYTSTNEAVTATPALGSTAIDQGAEAVAP